MNKYEIICTTLNEAQKGEKITLKSIREALEIGSTLAKALMESLCRAGLIDRVQKPGFVQYFKRNELTVGKIKMVLDE